MPKEWIVLHQAGVGNAASGGGYQVSSRKVGILGTRRPVEAGTFDTKAEADAFVAHHKGVDDSVSHIES